MAIPFKKPNGVDVPIIGQPLAVLGWTLLVSVECRCGTGRGATVTLLAQADHMGPRTSGVVCPQCGHLLGIAKLSMNGQGQLVFDINRSDVRADQTTAPLTPSPPAS